MAVLASQSASTVPEPVLPPHGELFRTGEYVPSFQPAAPDNPFRRLYERKRRAVVASVPGHGRRVLDLGGGMGRMAIPLAERHRVVLCDLSRDMLDLARSNAGPSLRLCVADAARLPFADGSFDHAVCTDLLPHLVAPRAVLGELRRVLAPGGRVVIDSTNAMPAWTLAYPRYVGRDPRRWLAVWRHGGVLPEWASRVWHYRRGEFLDLLREARFEVESLRSFGPPGAPKWHLAVAVPR
jgi:SAM-dependent methyltransferase